MSDSDGLLVIALDCADRRLVQRWSCENIAAGGAHDLETFSYSRDDPFTLEVWPTVATGLHPREHGVGDDCHIWENPILDALSNVTEHLPENWRVNLGKPFVMMGEELTFNTTDADHVFERGRAVGWPGITPAQNLGQAWGLVNLTRDEHLSKEELNSRVHANLGEELMEAIAALESGAPIVGVHSHILDVAGHVYANHEAELRALYESVDDFLGWVLERVENVVILSDHGMQVGFLGDEEPGKHSHDAMFATTLDAEPPRDMFDVRDWIEQHTSVDDQTTEYTERVVSDTTREQLANLGYVRGDD